MFACSKEERGAQSGWLRSSRQLSFGSTIRRSLIPRGDRMEITHESRKLIERDSELVQTQSLR